MESGVRTLGLSLLLLTQSFILEAQVHIDHFGYLPAAQKVAVIGDPIVGYNASESYTPGNTLQVRRIIDDVVVFESSPVTWNSGNTHEHSGDKGWWFDFSSLDIPGEYYIYDPSNASSSESFRIGNEVYLPILEQATRMFYYNRCGAQKNVIHAGNAWADGESFPQDTEARYLYDPDNQDLHRDVSGGWFDAGDYNKYITFAAQPLHDLLSAFEESPDAFSDNTNIPESGNGIPDIIDEIVWELEWMLKMCNEDGTVHIKAGSISFEENSNAPPSQNFDPRYYGPTCSSASIACAGVFAHASIVLQQFDDLEELSNELRSKAEVCFAHASDLIYSNALEENCDDQGILAGDADWSVYEQQQNAITAAVYLFELTNEIGYSAFVTDFYQTSEQMFNGFWGPYNLALSEALLRYAAHPNSNDQVESLIQTSFITAVTNNWNGFFRFNEDDLYRGYMPEWSYHWGSNMPRCQYGNLNYLVIRFGFAGSNEPSNKLQAESHLHWLHGTNPLGLCYLSNMGAFGSERSLDQIYHAWFADGSDWDDAESSLYGPAPGFLSGGPNAYFSVSSLTPPSGQPLQKSYLDFNDGWPLNSWEVSEPAIYYQAAYVRLLANLVDTSLATNVHELQTANSITAFPNPCASHCVVRASKIISWIRILDSKGLFIKQIDHVDLQEVEIQLEELRSGLYFIQTNLGNIRILKQ